MMKNRKRGYVCSITALCFYYHFIYLIRCSLNGSILDAGSIQKFPVFSYSIRNLAYFDKFIG